MIIIGSTGMQEDEWVNPFQPSVSLYIEQKKQLISI